MTPTSRLIGDWAWPQYAVIVYVALLTILWLKLNFTSGGRKAPGVKLWVLTAWAFFVYALYAGGFWK